MRKPALVALGLGLLILLLGVSMPFVHFQTIANDGAIGIIGGADGPTYFFFLFSLFNGLPFVFVLCGATIVITALLSLLLHSKVIKYCTLLTSAISLALSAVGGLGLTCAFLWFTIAAFGEMSRYPIAYPVSIAVGIGSLCTFIVLISLYLKHRRANWSWQGFVIDILTSILYLPAFFFVFAWIAEL